MLSLLFSMLSRLVISFSPRSKHLLISWLQSPSAVMLEPKKIKSVTVSIVSPSICHEVMGPDARIFVFWMLSFKPTFSLSSFIFIKRLFSSSLLYAIRVVVILSNSYVLPFSSYLQSFPASESFPMSWFFASHGQSIGVSASTSVLPMNIQDWLPLGRAGQISWDSQEYSPSPEFKSINSLALSFLYDPTLTSIHDYWKNHSWEHVDLCRQSNVSAF